MCHTGIAKYLLDTLFALELGELVVANVVKKKDSVKPEGPTTKKRIRVTKIKNTFICRIYC